MSKKKRKNRNGERVSQRSQNSQRPESEKANGTAERSAPKFEIGKKGDEFDVMYTEAVQKEQNRITALFTGIGKRSAKAIPDLASFSVLGMAALIMSLSFAFLSRSGKAPLFKFEKVPDGSYIRELTEYYRDRVPFGDSLRKLGNALGLCELKEFPPDEEDEFESGNIPAATVTEPTTEAAVTEPPMAETEPTTTAPTTTETPTSAPSTEETEITEPDTFRMYACRTANMRLEPDDSSMIMGYFYTNERVDVIEILDDGWASIWFGGTVLYIKSDDLSESRVRVTAEVTTEEEITTEETTETEITEPETEPETTTEPETEPEPTVTEAPEETEKATTPEGMSPETSRMLEYFSRLKEQEEMYGTH